MSQAPRDPLLLPTSPRFDFPVFEDPVRRRFRLEEEKANQPGFVDLFGAGINQEWVPFSAYRFLRKAIIAPDDPSYEGFSSLPQETQDHLLDGVPVTKRRPIQMAYSLHQAELISASLKRAFEAEKMLNDAGWTGLTARLGAALTDPIAVAIGIGTGGIGTAMARAKSVRTLTGLASGASRGKLIVRSGLIAGAENTALEAALLLDNPAKSPTDLLFATAAGMMLGGGGSVLTSRTYGKTQKAAQNLTEQILALDAQRMANVAGMSLTDKGEALLARYTGTEKGKELYSSVLNAAGLDPQDLKFYLDLIEEGDVDLNTALGKLVGDIQEAPLPEKIGMSAEEAVRASFARASAAGQTLTAKDKAEMAKRFGLEGAAPDGDELTPAARADLEEALGEDANIILPGDEVTIERELNKGQLATITSVDVEEGMYFAKDQNGNEIVLSPGEASRAGKLLGKPQDVSAVGDQRGLEATPLGDEARRVGGPPPPRNKPQAGDVSFFGRSSSAIGRKINAVAISMAGRLVRNPAPNVRRLISILAQNAIQQKGTVQTLTASEGAFRHSQIRLGAFWQVAKPAYQDWAKGQNLGFVERNIKTAKFDEFFEEVGKAVRRDPGEYTENIHINQVADQIRLQMREMLEFGQRHGVRGLENVEINPNYLPRIWSIEKIHRLDQEKGAEWLKQALVKALMDANPDIDEPLAQRWARGMNKIIRNTEKYTDLQRSQIFNAEATELMREAMAEAGMDAGDIESIMRLVANADDAKPTSSRARKRNFLTETIEHEGTSLEEAMESNASTLMTLYSKQIVGASMISKVLEEMSRVTGREMVTTARLLDFLGSEMDKTGMAETLRNKTRKKIETMIRAIEGKRIHEAGQYSELLANVRAFNFLRVSGQFGIAQAPEFGSVLGTVALRAINRQIPAFGSIFSRARNGNLNNQLLHEMEAVIGAGLNWRNSEVLSRIDIDGQLIELGKTSSRTLRRSQRLMAAANFMTPITVMQERMAAAVVAQRFFDQAMRGRAFGKARLASLGLSEADGKLLARTIKKYATREDSAFGGPRLVRVNFDQWGSKAANEAEELAEIHSASRLIGAIQRWSSRTVQENDIGNLSFWMTLDVGRLIAQFKTFGLVAWDKQFLARGAMIIDGLSMRESELAYHATAEALLGAAFAAAGYSLQAYTNSAGRDDREEFLKKELTLEKLGAIAFQRSTFASILPDVLDNIFWMAGQNESVFTGRTSGLTTVARPEVLLANPSFDLLGGFGKTLRAISTTARGDDFTKKEYKRAVGLVPMNRLTPMIILADLLAGERGLDLEDD